MMKKSALAIMLTGAVALNVMGASASFAAGPDEHNQKTHENVHAVTLEQSKTIALTHHKGFVKKTEMKKEKGIIEYVVQVVGEDGKVYKEAIDAKNGKVLRNEVVQHVNYLPIEKIKNIALKQHKGFVKASVAQHEKGTEFYQVAVIGEDGKEHLVNIDPKNGRVLKNETVQHVHYMTIEKIKNIALKQHKGFVKSVEMKHENGADVYHIHVHGQDSKDHEVKIDAKTGGICK